MGSAGSCRDLPQLDTGKGEVFSHWSREWPAIGSEFRVQKRPCRRKVAKYVLDKRPASVSVRRVSRDVGFLVRVAGRPDEVSGQNRDEAWARGKEGKRKGGSDSGLVPRGSSNGSLVLGGG